MASDSSGGIREWMNTGSGKWVTGLGGLALIGAAVWGVWAFAAKGGYLGGKRAAMKDKGRNIIYICTSPPCGSTGKMHVEFDEAYPAVCPKCRQKSAVPGFKCTTCGKVFVKTESMVFRCPHCNKLYERMPGGLRPPPEVTGTPPPE